MVNLKKQNFFKNKNLYQSTLKMLRKNMSEDVQIDHVGSTAIPNMYGKNIIDILIGARDQKQFYELKETLTKLNFYPSENSKNEIYQFFASKREETQSGDIHLHLVITDTDRYREFLILKNYLLNNKNEVEDYSNLKKTLINNGIIDRKQYKTAKSEYVTKLIERAKKYSVNK